MGVIFCNTPAQECTKQTAVSRGSAVLPAGPLHIKPHSVPFLAALSHGQYAHLSTTLEMSAPRSTGARPARVPCDLPRAIPGRPLGAARTGTRCRAGRRGLEHAPVLIRRSQTLRSLCALGGQSLVREDCRAPFRRSSSRECRRDACAASDSHPIVSPSVITVTRARGFGATGASQPNASGFAPAARTGAVPWGVTSATNSPFGPYSLQSVIPRNSR